jgi:hypothetical protein
MLKCLILLDSSNHPSRLNRPNRTKAEQRCQLKCQCRSRMFRPRSRRQFSFLSNENGGTRGCRRGLVALSNPPGQRRREAQAVPVPYFAIRACSGVMCVDILSVSCQGYSGHAAPGGCDGGRCRTIHQGEQASGAARLLQRSIVEERANSLMIHSRGWGRKSRLWPLHDSGKPAGESGISGCRVCAG